MTTTFRATSPADLLSAIPAMAGYNPQESVVILPLCQTRSIGLFRFDLPVAEPSQFAATALGIVCRLEEVTGMVVIVYTNLADAKPRDNPYAELAVALRRVADACGIELSDMIFVMRTGWFCEADDTATPLADIADPPPVGGGKPRSSQTSGTRLPRVRPERKTELRDALTLITKEIEAAREHTAPHSPAHSHPLERVYDVVEAATRASRARTSDDALLLWALSRPIFRDVALSQWCHRLDKAAETLEHQLNWLDGKPYPPGDNFLMGEGPPPDAARLRHALVRVRRLAAMTDGADRAAPLACAAWITWALGQSTHADVYARQALTAQPGHGLSEIILAMCANGHLPAWAFPRENRQPR